MNLHCPFWFLFAVLCFSAYAFISSMPAFGKCFTDHFFTSSLNVFLILGVLFDLVLRLPKLLQNENTLMYDDYR